jgi:hypothetical protein
VLGSLRSTNQDEVQTRQEAVGREKVLAEKGRM